MHCRCKQVQFRFTSRVASVHAMWTQAEPDAEVDQSFFVASGDAPVLSAFGCHLLLLSQ